MMNKLTVVVEETGEIIHRLDESIPLDFGKKEITRIAEIVWNNDRQKWNIKILQGWMSGCYLPDVTAVLPAPNKDFSSYEEAVTAEKEFLEGGYMTEFHIPF